MKDDNSFKDPREIKQYQKRGFIKNLPFGLKATFIKYWFYGALYFFCFMGLGYLPIPNENLVLITGLIGGVLFDIALYNIFLLFAETREEASKWWIFKSKKFYSIFINVVVIVGLFFAFYYIMVPFKIAIESVKGLWWLFQEPLSAALLLTILDTALCWLKNLGVYLVTTIFLKNKKVITKINSYINIIDVSPVSVTFELNEDSPVSSTKPYNILLNNEIIYKKVTDNVFTIFDLKPDTKYRLTINRISKDFITSKISKFYKAYEGNDLEKIIDVSDQHSLIVVNKGNYHLKKLNLKNNLVLYIRKDAKIHVNNDINIDKLSKIKIIGEGSIIGKTINIKNSSYISIIGLNINPINLDYSTNIDLFNLTINSDNVNSVAISNTSIVNIVGNKLSNSKNGVNIIAENNNESISTRDISIRNVLIGNVEASINIGNETFRGIHTVNIINSKFINSKIGFNYISKLNNGKDAIVKDVNADNIVMDNVMTPIVMNMYDDSELNKKVTNMPFFGSFTFNELNAINYEYAAGIFYGLNERYIEEIKISNSTFSPKEKCGNATIINNIKASKNAFIVKNVRSFNLDKVIVNNYLDKKIIEENVSEIVDK